MKLVFDFDDTVFDSERFKNERFFNCLLQYGITSDELKESYDIYRKKNEVYDIHLHINGIFQERNITESAEEVVFAMVQNIEEYVFPEYKEVFRKYGRENIFILTQGSEHFQNLKVRHSKIEELVEKVFIVPGEKQEILEKIALLWPNEIIMFFDDKFQNMISENNKGNLLRIFVGNIELLTDKDKQYLEQNNILISTTENILRNIPLFLENTGIEQNEFTRNSKNIGRII